NAYRSSGLVRTKISRVRQIVLFIWSSDTARKLQGDPIEVKIGFARRLRRKKTIAFRDRFIGEFPENHARAVRSVPTFEKFQSPFKRMRGTQIRITRVQPAFQMMHVITKHNLSSRICYLQGLPPATLEIKFEHSCCNRVLEVHRQCVQSN